MGIVRFWSVASTQYREGAALMKPATLRQLPWRVDEIQLQSLPVFPL
jgi:hypothetical protein